MCFGITLSALSVIAEENNEQVVSAETTSPSATVSSIGAYTSEQDRLSKMNMVAKSSGTTLYFDPTTCDIAVSDEYGVNFSTPYDLAQDAQSSDDYKQRIASQLRIEYINSKKSTGEVLSFKDCVSLGQFTTQSIKNGIQVNMAFGRKEQRLLLPLALPADSFENIILASLQGRAASRLKAFYKKYDVSSTSEAQISAIKERFPAVIETPLYILKSVTDTEKKEIEEYIRSTPYSFDQLATDLKKSGAKEDEVDTPYFEISIQYQLDKGDLLVSIPSKSINYDSTKYQLTKISVLGNLMSAPVKNDGYIFVPDGSGAIMNFNRNKQKSGSKQSLPVFGYDRSLTYIAGYEFNCRVRIPVFGIKNESRALLAILEQGAALATISVSSGGVSSGYAYAETTFSYQDSDSFTFKDIGKQYTWSLADKNAYNKDFQIRYKILNGESANYSGMAASYRNHLIQTDSLAATSDAASDLPFYLGLYGTVKHQEQFLFFMVNRNIPLTTFDNALTIADDLNKRGLSQINLRYLGWANGGIDHTAFNKASVESVLGGSSGLKDLQADLKERQVQLFMDADMAYVSRDGWFDGFSPSGHAGRMLDKTFAGYNEIDISSGLMDSSRFKYAVRPSVMSSFFRRFQKYYQKLKLEGLSLGSLGSNLNADKSTKKGANRDTAQDYTTQILEKADKDYSVMTEGGNSYVYSYADHIIDLASSSSGYPDADYSIPFLQMVLHGSIPYSSAAINLSGNPRVELLKAVENGAAPYFEVVYQNSDKLKTSTQRDLYSVDYGIWADTMVDYYKQANGVLKGLGNDTIVEHEYPQKNLAVVTYSSGIKIAVNYNDINVSVEGISVPAQSFLRIS